MVKSYLELIDRAKNGPLVQKEDWDLEKVAITTKRLVKKYQIRWNPDEVVPADPGLADRVFQAGLELAQQIGVYHAGTGRVIEFAPGELENGLVNAPRSLEMGSGRDARVLTARKILDERPPLVWAGNPGVPTPEDIFQPMVMSWMQEPIVDLVTCGSLTEVDGFTVHTAEPTEITATRRELRLMREGLRKVGRPGMGMLAAQSSVSELGDLAVAHPDYLRPCDSHLIPLLNELIIDYRNIVRAAHAIRGMAARSNLAHRFKLWQRYMFTILVNGLRKAEATAAALDCRAFGSYPTRTNVKTVTYEPASLVLPVVTAVLIAALVLIERMG